MPDQDYEQRRKEAEAKHRSYIKPDSELDVSTFKTYPGNCHCGKFRFQITLPKINKIGECNCSICYMNGLRGLVWFPTEEGGLRKFEILEGDEEKDLGSYGFGNKHLTHKFCKDCGTHLFARNGSLIGVNGLALEPMPEIEAIPTVSWYTTKEDAKFREPFYKPEFGEPMKWMQNDEPLKEDDIEYQGHCHCGKARYVMRYKKMEEWEPSDCDCSFCFKSGVNNIYPPESNVQFHPEFDKNTTKYIIIHEEVKSSFCNTCGTHVSVDPGPKIPFAVLNVRTIEDPEENGEMLDHIKARERCKLKKTNRRNMEPMYEGKRHKIVKAEEVKAKA